MTRTWSAAKPEHAGHYWVVWPKSDDPTKMSNDCVSLVRRPIDCLYERWSGKP